MDEDSLPKAIRQIDRVTKVTAISWGLCWLIYFLTTNPPTRAPISEPYNEKAARNQLASQERISSEWFSLQDTLLRVDSVGLILIVFIGHGWQKQLKRSIVKA